MNLEDLRAVQVDERATDSLQPLQPTFYAEAADYLGELRERRDRLADRADDPFDAPEVRQLTDELETAEEVVEAIYERRVGKLVKRASLTAAGVTTDDTGLTEEEQALFADLVERIETHRGTVLEVLETGTETGADPGTTDETRGSGPGSKAGDDVSETAPLPTRGAESDEDANTAPPVDGTETAASEPVGTDGDREEESAADSTADPDRMTVRITANVGEIYGVDDRVYTLGDEDVVTLPSANAEPLLERGAAQRLE